MSESKQTPPELHELLGIMVEDVIRSLKQLPGTSDQYAAAMAIVVRQHDRIRRAHFKVLRSRRGTQSRCGVRFGAGQHCTLPLDHPGSHLAQMGPV